MRHPCNPGTHAMKLNWDPFSCTITGRRLIRALSKFDEGQHLRILETLNQTRGALHVRPCMGAEGVDRRRKEASGIQKIIVRAVYWRRNPKWGVRFVARSFYAKPVIISDKMGQPRVCLINCFNMAKREGGSNGPRSQA